MLPYNQEIIIMLLSNSFVVTLNAGTPSSSILISAERSSTSTVMTSKLSVTKDSNSRLLGDALARIILLFNLPNTTYDSLFSGAAGGLDGAAGLGGI